jgi:hypothetical protein
MSCKSAFKPVIPLFENQVPQLIDMTVSDFQVQLPDVIPCHASLSPRLSFPRVESVSIRKFFPLKSGKSSAAKLAQARQERSTLFICEWCFRSYAVKAVKLRHQRTCVKGKFEPDIIEAGILLSNML